MTALDANAAVVSHIGKDGTLKELVIEQFIPQIVVERFIIAIFPRAAGLDVQGFDLQSFEPRTNHIGGKFAAIVRQEAVMAGERHSCKGCGASPTEREDAQP